MIIQSLTFESSREMDGTIYVTSANLPGIRLVVRPGGPAEPAISRAIDVFVPFYEMAQEIVQADAKEDEKPVDSQSEHPV
jgi:hypothetical protein